MELFETLEWDSRFFGFPVARLNTELRSPEVLESAFDALRQRGVRLAYWLPTMEQGLEQLARSLGGTLVGTHVRYEREFQTSEAVDAMPDAQIVPCTAISPEIEALAVEAGRLSRFALDPAMPPGTVDRMYRRWVQRSLSGPMGDEVLIAGDAGSPRGLITLKYASTAGEIGLVAVAEGARRSGVGRALMDAAASRFRRHGVRNVIVTTQGENRAACQLYEASGYAARRVGLAVHFWLAAPS